MTIAAITCLCLGHLKRVPVMRRGYAVVRVETTDGLVGHGEASSNYGHSYPTLIRAVVEDVLAPNLAGSDETDIPLRLSEMHGLLDGYIGWSGLTPQAIGAVEMALWDIAGQKAGKPIAELLGGKPKDFALYCTGNTAFEQVPEDYAADFAPAVEVGFQGFKVRIGTEPDAAVKRVAATRAFLGPDKEVMVDAYWGYLPDKAIELSHRLAPYEVGFFEEPSPQTHKDFAGMAKHMSVPLAVGERVYSPAEFRALAEDGSATVLQPDAQICGGLLACMEVAAIAREHGLRISPHLGSPTAVGMAANMQWMSAANVGECEFDLDPELPLRDELAPGAPFGLGAIRDGRLACPGGPGLGVELDFSVMAGNPYVPGETYAEVFRDHERPDRRGS